VSFLKNQNTSSFLLLLVSGYCKSNKKLHKRVSNQWGWTNLSRTEPNQHSKCKNWTQYCADCKEPKQNRTLLLEPETNSVREGSFPSLIIMLFTSKVTNTIFHTITATEDVWKTSCFYHHFTRHVNKSKTLHNHNHVIYV